MSPTQPSPLARWGRGRPKGWLSALMYTTRLSWGTLQRAKKGRPLSYRSAMLLSKATGIPVHHLTDDQAAQPKRARARKAA